MYVYVEWVEKLWAVGFYTPLGRWIEESNYSSPEKAAARTNYLNGGSASKRFTEKDFTLFCDYEPMKSDNEID